MRPAPTPWFHVQCNTYGTWAHGDARGFRTRHHRQHVEGDYKRPPPAGKYDALRAHARASMTRDDVHLDAPDARQLACEAVVQSLQDDGIAVLCVALDDHHVHALARFDDLDPRHWFGRAKGRSARALSAAGVVAPGGVWGVRCECVAVRDRGHQLNAFWYIVDHGRRGAHVWTNPALGRVPGRRSTRG